MGHDSSSCNCKYKAAFDNQKVPMFIINAETGSIEDVNLAACDYYSYTKEELLSMNITDINVSTKEKIFQEINEVKKKKLKFLKFQHKLANGELRDVEVHSTYFKVGNKEMLSSLIHDVKEKSELEEKYLQHKTYFTNLFNNSPEAIAIVDKEFKILNTNEKFEKLFCYNLSEIENEDITKLLCENPLDDTSYHFRKSVHEGKFISEEAKRKTKDGQLVDVIVMGFPLIMNGEVTGAYCIYTDLSEAKARERKIEKLTYKDSLTGLFNRGFFFENVESEILKKEKNYGNEERLAILVLKANEYKEINDALGHEVGDLTLKKFSLRLRESVGNDYLVSRFIGDEFAILIPNLKDAQEIDELTEIIVRNLEKPFFKSMREVEITTNVGSAIYPNDGKDPITLIRKAEIAMYEGKKTEENIAVQFEDAHDEEIQENFWIKRDLLRALKEDELYLHYQPIYDIAKNKLVGVEALIRWNHKKKGNIPPLKFIPIAEKSGLIHSIGGWVLRQACFQNMKWRELGYEPINMSVNVSVIQLEKPYFIDIVKKALKDSGLEAKYLQLEITETYFTQDYELIKKTIKELSDLGVKLAIDDFGTGYSSLGQLSELNINNLKIDRMFIDEVDKNMNKSKIVKAIISLASSLDIGLTAEGVERQEELNFLKNSMCVLVQGYLFSKPVGVKEIEQLLEVKKNEQKSK